VTYQIRARPPRPSFAISLRRITQKHHPPVPKSFDASSLTGPQRRIEQSNWRFRIPDNYPPVLRLCMTSIITARLSPAAGRQKQFFS